MLDSDHHRRLGWLMVGIGLLLGLFSTSVAGVLVYSRFVETIDVPAAVWINGLVWLPFWPFMLWFGIGSFKKARAHDRIERYGIRTWGRIDGVGGTSMRVNGRPVLSFKITVLSENHPPYTFTYSDMLPPNEKRSTVMGRTVPIVLDPDNPRYGVIAWQPERFAGIAQAPPLHKSRLGLILFVGGFAAFAVLLGGGLLIGMYTSGSLGGRTLGAVSFSGPGTQTLTVNAEPGRLDFRAALLVFRGPKHMQGNGTGMILKLLQPGRPDKRVVCDPLERGVGLSGSRSCASGGTSCEHEDQQVGLIDCGIRADARGPVTLEITLEQPAITRLDLEITQ